jgi:hypothetical protein
MLLTLMMQLRMFGHDAHDGGWRKIKSKPVKPKSDDLRKSLKEGFYGVEKSSVIANPLQIMEKGYSADKLLLQNNRYSEIAEKLVTFEQQEVDDEEAMTLLLLS